MSLVTPEQSDDLVSLRHLVSALGAELVIIGATAFRAFFPDNARYTEDIDVAVALDFDGFSLLEERLVKEGWRRDSKQEQRWYAPRGNRMDILPAGPQSLARGKIVWPTSGMVMSLAGFDYVFQQTAEVQIAPGISIKAITPPLLFLLKVVSYLDDPHRRAKDLGDIYELLRAYKRGTDDEFSDLVIDAELDAEFVPAFLLGSDLAAFCANPERTIVEQFLSESRDLEGLLMSRLASYEASWGSAQERPADRLAAFAQGFRLRTI